MSSYDALAASYDALTVDVEYRRRADYLTRQFHRSALPVETVLDLACGTGTCATVVAGVLNGLCDRKALVHLLGGDLEIEWNEDDNCVYMTGSATEVFEGEITLPEEMTE